MNTIACPDRERLAAWLCAELASPEAEAVLAHLEGCPRCEAAVQELEREAAALLSGVGRPMAADEFECEPQCRRMLRDLESLCVHPPPEAPPADDRPDTPGVRASTPDRESGPPNTASSTAATPRTSGRRLRTMALVIVLAAAGVTLYFNTGEGVVVLTVSEPDAVVTIDGGRQVHVASPDDSLTIVLPAGRHELAVTRDGFTTWSRSLRLVRDGRQILTAELKPLAAQERPGPETAAPAKDAPGAAQPAGTGDDIREVAEWVLRRGGEIMLYPDGRTTSLEALPAGEFGIQWIHLWSSGLTDDELERIGRISTLQGLHVADNELTDAGLWLLPEGRRYRWLYLSRTAITDEGMKRVAAWTTLETLALTGTQVTDAGIAELRDFDRLRELLVGETAVGDATLAHVPDFPALVRLDLRGTAVTDEGLRHLSELPQLGYLILADTAVTDAGLEQLKPLTTLKELELRRTQTTAAAVAGLQAALPECRIEH